MDDGAVLDDIKLIASTHFHIYMIYNRNYYG